MKPPALRLKRGHEAARTHPWIFKGDVADVSDVDAGSAIAVVDAGGRFVGRGFYNPRPALCCRILTWTDEPLDAAFFRRRFEAAVALRGRGHAQGPPTLCRLVWSEADGLPGLVVDRYGPVLVTQCLTLGMARARPVVTAALGRDVPRRVGLRHGRSPRGPARGIFGGARLGRRLRAQDRAGRRGWRHVRGDDRRSATRPGSTSTSARTGPRSVPWRVIEMSSTPSATPRASPATRLRGGARRAVCIESSPEANAGARQNLELNGFTAQAEIRASNVFDELRRLERDGARFGVVVLDPPPFARSRSALDAAARGYKEINLRALRLLERGGSLFTFSCSHHVSESMFEEICRDASADAGVRRPGRRRAWPRRTIIPCCSRFPETRYLKGLQLEVV